MSLNSNRGLITIGVIAGSFLLIGLVFVGMYVSANNSGNRHENIVKFAHEDSKNVLGQYAPRLREALGVTKIQETAVADVITKANESRYGKTGSSATVQWIQEQNPNLDQASYGRIINMIEAGRNDFQNKQTEKLDKIRQYETALGNMPGSFFLRLAGYPTPAYLQAHYDKVVISGHADEAFTTGRDDGVNLNGF